MHIVFSRNVFLVTFVLSIFYIGFSLYLMNMNLITQTVVGNYPPLYKFNLILALTGGMWTAMSHTALGILIATAILTGLNVALLAKKIRILGGLRSTHVLIGGGSFLGIVGSGCAACGLPLLSLLGLSGSAIYLPFHGSEFSYIALILLLLSFYVLIKGNKKTPLICSIPKRN